MQGGEFGFITFSGLFLTKAVKEHYKDEPHGDARGPIAQLVEPPAHNRMVPGSTPGGPTIKIKGIRI